MVIKTSEDYREKTVREFIDMIQDPISREEYRCGIIELLKMDGYTEDQIYQMKVKEMSEKLKDVAYQSCWLLTSELEKLMKKFRDKGLPPP